MNRLSTFILSKNMAWLMLTAAALIMAAAVTVRLSDDRHISGTYTGQVQAAECKDIQYSGIREMQDQTDTWENQLATSQEYSQTSGSSDTEIPCAWSDITISLSDFNLICTTVYCEAGNQSVETQIMTALTILNRLSDENYPDTVREVIYQDSQYTVTGWTGFEQYGWTSSVEQAVTYALEVNEHPRDMFFFRTEHYHKFGHPYMVSDDLYFSTLN